MKKFVSAAACAALVSGGLLGLSSAAAAATGGKCPSGTVALTFDDGPSFYRPQTLRILRDKLVPATFFDIGMRVAANPHITRFEVREGHTVLNHTYRHDNLGQLSAADVRRELLATEAVFKAAGVRMPFNGVRPPFGGTSPTSEAVIAELGYRSIGADIGGFDFIPTTPAETIRDAILDNLVPGGIIIMHDGPIDTPAGAAVVAALPQVIDGTRARGYCFGSLDANVQVVPDRLKPTRKPIPRIVNPVPFRPIQLAGDPPLSPPQPYAVVQGISVRHLTVDVADLVASGSIARSLARHIERHVDRGERAQIRADLAGQRRQLETIRDLIEEAPASKIDAAGRATLLAQVDRMITSIP